MKPAKLTDPVAAGDVAMLPGRYAWIIGKAVTKVMRDEQAAGRMPAMELSGALRALQGAGAAWERESGKAVGVEDRALSGAMEEGDEWLTTTRAAELVGVTRQRIGQLCQAEVVASRRAHPRAAWQVSRTSLLEHFATSRDPKGIR